MRIKNKVFITNTSSVSCAGYNNEELFQNISIGKTGIKQSDKYSSDRVAIGKIQNQNTFYQNLIIQCQNILSSSNLKNFENTILIIGSSVGGISSTEEILFNSKKSYKDIDPKQHNIQAIADTLKKKFDFYDDISFSTACTSSANALGYAYEVLSKNIYNNALVVGIDSLCQITIEGFISLGILSSKPCKPFDKKRDGMNVSEAIACLLLQNKKTKNSVELCGVGYSSDAYHMTQPNTKGAKTAMLYALKSANIQPNQIDYINAHGTGTLANDTSEANAILEIFRSNPQVSSTKSITGHTLGAAGALEAIISCMIIQKQTIPKSTNLEIAQNPNLNLSTKTTKANIQYTISNSFAFGGNNCSLVFGKTQ